MRADLARLTEAVRVALGTELIALLLVGGYARGEGGSVAGPDGFRPYNDYDLVAVVRHPRAVRLALAELEVRWASALGVHVDVWPVSPRLVAAPPPTLFWLDVALGGARVLLGDLHVLDGARSVHARRVPLSEAARLLANRATGLALSSLSLRPGADDASVRHVHKAVLAVGDARLLAANRYQPTVRERLAELERLRGAPGVGDELAALYATAKSFRERPDLFRIPDGEAPARWYARHVERIGRWHLEIEHARVGTPVDAASYAGSRERLFADLPDVAGVRAVASSLRAAFKLSLPLSPWVGHPRERLARASVALAYGASSASPAEARAAAARLLGLTAAKPTDQELRLALLRLVPLGG